MLSDETNSRRDTSRAIRKVTLLTFDPSRIMGEVQQCRRSTQCTVSGPREPTKNSSSGLVYVRGHGSWDSRMNSVSLWKRMALDNFSRHPKLRGRTDLFNAMAESGRRLPGRGSKMSVLEVSWKCEDSLPW